MKQSLVILFCVLAAVLGLGGGYVLRGSSFHEAANSDRGGSGEATGTSFSGKGEQRAQSRALRVKRNVERSHGAHHWLHWMSGVEDATLAELPGLARMAKDNPGALRMIAYRWVELDPHNLLEILVKESKQRSPDTDLAFPIRELAGYLFEEWPKLDAESAIAALSAPDALMSQSGLRHSVLNTIMKENPKRGLELMGAWSILNFGPDTKGVKEWAKRDPRAAVQAVLDHPFGYGAQYSMEAIAKVWSEDNPAAALEFAGEASGRLSVKLREKVLAEWAGRDLEAASEWLGEQSAGLQAELSPIIVGAWGKDDAEGALAWCEENLTGHRLLTSVTKLAKGAAAEDAASAGELVSAMDSSPVRTQAAIAVAEEWFPQSWPSNQTIEPAAIEWLRNLGDPELQGEVLEKVSWGWSTQDLNGLLAFLNEPHASRAPDSVFHTAVRILARSDPRRALEWAADLPVERVEPISATAFSQWTRHQPGAAAQWVTQLPANDSRRGSLLRSYVTASLHLPQQAAAEHMAHLSVSDRALARETIRSAAMEGEKRQSLLRLLAD